MFIPFPLPAQVGERYIEVTGTSEIEVVPDRIHYVCLLYTSDAADE